MIPRNRVALLRTLKKHSVGMEVGVYRGQFSANILKHVKPSRLYLVDAWRRLPDTSRFFTDDWHHLNLFSTSNRLSRWIAAGIVRPICAKSDEAARMIPDNELDWIYIDADHTYQGCKGDLVRWWSKVKSGGIVMAHDYDRKNFPGVVKAIDEFEKERDIKRCGETEEVHRTIWFKKG